MQFFHPFVGMALSLLVSACAASSLDMSALPASSAGLSVVEKPTLTPVEMHGALSVQSGKILGKDGKAVSLAGPSFFWSTSGWGMDRFYNKAAVKTFAKDWNAGIVRAAISAQGKGSYLDDPKANLARAYRVIDAAIEAGIYVVVDWHSHAAEDNVEAATDFFTKVATKYGDTPNVIYEIYNEPLPKTDWDTTIKPYAERMIETIRAIDPDNLIAVGTQSWSQDVDKAVDNPLNETKNIVYVLHFYAAGHKDALRKRAQYALDKGLPIMVTEWGTVNYDGDGAVDKVSSEAWLEFMKANDLSHMMWAVSDKDEGAAMFVPGVKSDGEWSDEDLTANGRYAKEIIQGWSER